ncbi:MAG: hypothetical protein R6W68_15580, partial [Ignavibacteriaceae bacterium]
MIFFDALYTPTTCDQRSAGIEDNKHAVYRFWVVDPVIIEDIYFADFQGNKDPGLTQCPTHTLKIHTGRHNTSSGTLINHTAHLQIYNGTSWATITEVSLPTDGGTTTLDWEILKNYVQPYQDFKFRTIKQLTDSEFSTTEYEETFTFAQGYEGDITSQLHEDGNLVTFTGTSTVNEILIRLNATSLPTLKPNGASSTETILGPGTYWIQVTPSGEFDCPLKEELYVLDLDESGIQDYIANNGDTVQIRERGSEITIPLNINYSSTQSINVKIDNSSYLYVLSDKITINEKDIWSGTVQSPPLKEGTYDIFVTDENGNISNLLKELKLSEPEPIKFNLESFSNQIKITNISGGGGGHLYNGSDIINGTVITTQNIGTNQITITDGFGNSKTNPVSVIGPISISGRNPTRPTCHNGSDGSFEFSVNKSEGTIGVTVTKGNDPISQENIVINQVNKTVKINNLIAGDYNITVTDTRSGFNPCSLTESFTIPERDAVSINSIDITKVGGKGTNTGSITVSASGGNGGLYSFYLFDEINQLKESVLNKVSSAIFENLPGSPDPGKKYYIDVKDSNGCFNSGGIPDNRMEARVQEPATALTLNGESTDPSCYGYSNAIITLTASGGWTHLEDVQYSADGETWQSNRTFGPYPVGIRTFHVIDKYGGTDFVDVTISQPDPLLVEVHTITNNPCHGENIGEIIYRVSGGTTPYRLFNGATKIGDSFTLSDDFTYLKAENLPAGTYENFIIKDENGCSETVPSANVSEPERLRIVNIQTTHTTCELDNGKIMAGAEGGVSPYSFTWSQTGSEFLQVDSLMETIDVSFIDSLKYGQYNLQIEDSNQCQTKDIIDVHPYVNPTIGSAPVVNPTCFGDTDGSVEVIPIIGSSPIAMYELRDTINELISSNNTGRFDGLADGKYHLYVTDTTGCESNSPRPVSLRQPDSLIIVNNSVFHVISKGEGTGYINNTIKGGNEGANEIKLISSSDITLSTIERTKNNPFEFTGLFAGNYSIHAVDPKGCEFTLANIEVAEPDTALGFTIINKNDALCKAQTGSFTVEAYGGWGGPYGYKRISDSEFMQTNTFRGLSAGNYQLTVRDSRGGIFTDSILIYEPVDSLMAYMTNNNPPTCGNNGNITLYISGGTSPYNLIKKGESDTIFIAEPQELQVDSLGAGEYIFYITDANGCDFVLEASLPGTDLLEIDGFNIKYPAEPGESDGEIEVMVSGGNLPYLFSWKDMEGAEFPETGANLIGVPSGNYLVTVTEKNGCIQSASGYLPDIYDVPLKLVDKRDETSYQANNGYALHISDINVLTEVKIITPTSVVLRFDITDSTELFYSREDTLYLQNLPGGKYRILATDTHGVTAYNEFFIKPYAEFLADEVQISHARRIDEGSGSITVFVSGGVGEYDFIWESLTANVDTLYTEGFENTSTLSGAYAGLYRFTAKDKYHNIISDTYEIKQPDAPLKITITESANVTCKNKSNAYTIADGRGGWGNYQYRVDFHEAFSNDPMYTNLDAREYYFYVIDRSGVQDSIAITITEPDFLRAAIESIDSVQCKGFHDGNFHFNISGGTEPYFFSEAQFSGWNEGAVAQNYSEGTYTFTFTDSNQCVGMDTLTVYMPEPDSLLFRDIIVNHTTCDTDNGAIEVTMRGGTKPYRYQWYNIKNESIGNSDFISGMAQNGYYYLDVYDQNNCHTEFEQSIKPSSKPDITKIDLTDVICFGDSTGTAEVTDILPGEPFAPYTITWSHGLTGDFAGGFEKGVHHVSISDTNNCVTKKFFHIDSPDRLLASVTGTKDAHCFGYNDGFLEVQPHGGVGEYEYNWSNGST